MKATISMDFEVEIEDVMAYGGMESTTETFVRIVGTKIEATAPTFSRAIDELQAVLKKRLAALR